MTTDSLALVTDGQNASALSETLPWLDSPAPVTPRRLAFNLAEIDVRWDEDKGTLWSFMTPRDRPSFSPGLLRDLRSWQDEIKRSFREDDALQFVVLGSRFPGAFNLGGDLGYVSQQALDGNREALQTYGNACVDILFQNMQQLELPIITIALVQGDCFGGGFEAALSFNLIVAERQSRFALPETMFGMFPGVGAHSILSRRLSVAKAEQLMMSGKTYSAEEMYELGLVQILAEPGEGEKAVADYIRRTSGQHSGHCGIYRASREINPVTLDELRRVVDIWADTAIRLKPKNVKLMRRLAEAQSRLTTSRTAVPS